MEAVSPLAVEAALEAAQRVIKADDDVRQADEARLGATRATRHPWHRADTKQSIRLNVWLRANLSRVGTSLLSELLSWSSDLRE